MNKIYVVQSMAALVATAATRNIGWESTLKGAREMLLKNSEIIAETYSESSAHYPYALIESVEPGPYPENGKVEWYKFSFDTKRYVKIKPPAAFDGVVGFTMG